jgi:hypothetical protein
MTNNKEKTAVEWFGMEMGKLFAQYHGKIICIGEFHKRRFELEQQAKEMEQNQITLAHIDAAIFTEWDENTDARKNADQYYEQIYGGGEK